MTTEKRQFSRFPYQMTTEITIKEVTYKIDDLINLSVGGCMITPPVKVKPDTRCTIKISLGGRQGNPEIIIEGSIVRSKKKEAAIKFTRIDPNSLFHLQNIARYNSSNPDDTAKEIEKNPGIKS